MDLSRSDREVLDAVLPSGAHPKLSLGISETGFEAFLEDFRQVAPIHLWRAFRMGLLAGAWIAPLLVRRLPPITRLSRIEREQALAAMEGSGMPELRQLVSVLKTVVCLHYGALPQVREAIGYP